MSELDSRTKEFIGYDVVDLVNKGLVESSNNLWQTGSSSQQISGTTISSDTTPEDRTLDKVRVANFLEKPIYMPDGSYIYPLDSDMKGYSKVYWEDVGYVYNDGSNLRPKSKTDINYIDGLYYDSHEDCFDVAQPYSNTIVEPSPIYTYFGAGSYTSPKENFLKFDLNEYVNNSPNQEDKYKRWYKFVTGFNVGRLNSFVYGGEDAFYIKIINDSLTEGVFSKTVTVAESGNYVFSLYLSSNENDIEVKGPVIATSPANSVTWTTNTVSRDWKRFYVSANLTVGTEYEVKFKIPGNSSYSGNEIVKVAGLMLEKGTVPSQFYGGAISHFPDQEKLNITHVIALNLDSSVSSYLNNSSKYIIFSYEKKVNPSQPCYEQFRNLIYGYDSSGFLCVNGVSTNKNFSSHIGSWEHVIVQINGNSFYYCSIDAKNDVIDAHSTINSIDNKDLTLANYISSSGTSIYSAQILLGASISNSTISTYEAFYRNFVYLIKDTDIIEEIKKYMTDPSFSVKIKTDTDTIYIQSSSFIETY